MSFLSVEFILFCLVVLPLYFLVPQRGRLLYILIASLVFYAASSPLYTLVLVGLTLVDYGIARAIGGTEVDAVRNRWLYLSLALNLASLVLFKYVGFLNDLLAGLLALVGVVYIPSPVSILMPLGVSFYTFTKIAYIMDVHRKKIKPEANALTFATFITFFPNIASGPIERAGHLIPQLQATVRFDETRIVEGLRLILWGAFKKVVIADRLALYVNAVYDQPQAHQGLTLLTATFFLAFQIYADFSSYTDIARGIARILGFDLFENFRQPYLSKSVLEFWRRWHISLTTWIREYLFFPLSRFLLTRTKRRYPRVVEFSVYLIIMSGIGLWHGASAPFIIWGLLHGVYMGVESVLNARRLQLVPRHALTDVLKVVTTFLLVTFAWIFFRAATLSDAGYIISQLFNFGGDFAASLQVYGSTVEGYGTQLLLSLGLILLLIISDGIDSKWGIFTLFQKVPTLLRFGVYYALIAVIFGILISTRVVQNFVYFQF